MKEVLITCILFTLSEYCLAQPVTYVRTQTDFDKDIEYINTGKEIAIELSQGTYTLNKSIKANAPLYVKGENAVIQVTGDSYSETDAIKIQTEYYVYKLKHPIGPFGLFTDDKGKLLHVSESVDSVTLVNKTNDTIVGIYQPKDGIEIKIPITDNLKHLADKTFSMGYGYFDCGWASVNFQVIRSDNQYFYCKTINHTNVKDFNYDLTYYKKPIRYVLYNVEKDGKGIYYDDKYIYIPEGIKKVYHTGDSRSKQKSIKATSDFTVSGVTFDNVSVNVQQGAENVCNIENCNFTNTLGTTLSVDKKNTNDVKTVIIKDCNFIDCSVLNGNQVRLRSSYSGVNCITMSGCTLSRYSNADLVYKNCSASIDVSGDVTLMNNTVYNTCRDHFKLTGGHIQCTGNILYNTDAFNSKVYRNLSSDFGLIYCGKMYYNDNPDNVLTNTKHVIILEGNLLHGAYAYGGNGRGIFIDDGRGDVTCMYNIIFNTQKYSIDARYARKFKGISSVRVKLQNNLLGQHYRLETNGNTLGSNAPMSSGNILLYDEYNKTLNIVQKAKDVRLPRVKLASSGNDKNFYMYGSESTSINNLPLSDYVRKHIILK